MKYINIDGQAQVKRGTIKNTIPGVDSGTHLVDVIQIPYQALVEKFGQPNDETDEFKIDAQWLIFTPGGVATIYNWKDGKNHLGDQGLEVSDITEWHIGAHTPEPAQWVREALSLPEA